MNAHQAPGFPIPHPDEIVSESAGRQAGGRHRHRPPAAAITPRIRRSHPSALPALPAAAATPVRPNGFGRPEAARDVRDLARIERLSEIPRLLALLASRAGELLNTADLARTLQVPRTTLKRYLTLMETTFLVRLLPAWFSNLGKRLAKAPKLLLTDTGLLTHLIDADAGRLAGNRTLFGHVLENFVAMELIKQLGWSTRRCRLFHFRTAGGAEVDLVLEDRAGRLVGVEVKCAASVQRRDFRGLETLAALSGARFVRGVVLCTGAAAVPFGRNLSALPVSQLWA